MVFREKYDNDVDAHVLKENAENDSKLGYTLLVITLLTQVGVLSIGYDLGINSGAVLLVENSEYMPLDSLWKQLIIAGALPSAIIITLFASQLSDIIGRKRTVMTAAISYIVGAIISGAAVNRTMLLIGRLVIGCGHGEMLFTSDFFFKFLFCFVSQPRHIPYYFLGLSTIYSSICLFIYLAMFLPISPIYTHTRILIQAECSLSHLLTTYSTSPLM